MKKYFTAASILLAAAFLFSCSGNSDTPQETAPPQEKDWHNSIEYEGSFYVNEATKLLYSLDRGTVTLWDDKGNGSVLQTLKYDTTADDAMERIEFNDENFDGNGDIRVIYDETAGCRYNLWLWNESKGSFDMCSKYKDIVDPMSSADEKVVISTSDNGIFGVLEKKYAFDEHMNIAEVSSAVLEDGTVADSIAKSLSLGSTVPAESKISIDKLECTAFIAKNAEGKVTGYLAYNGEGEWYADMGALGFYRSLDAQADSIVLADYAGDAGQAQKFAEASFEGDISVTYRQRGYMLYKDTDGSQNMNEAYRYTVTADGEVCCYIVSSTNLNWYITTDGESYKRLNKNTLEIENAVTDVFQGSEG